MLLALINAHGSRTQDCSCGMPVIPLKLLETFFSNSWKIRFQTYQVNKIKLHACLTSSTLPSTLLESGFHQVGFIKSSHALSAFISNSTEAPLTYFICIFCQYVHYWALITDFKNLMYVLSYLPHSMLCPLWQKGITSCTADTHLNPTDSFIFLG